MTSESLFRGLLGVKFQQKIANWKAESLRNSVSKELASEDASIGSYSDFESDRSAVGHLRRRAFGGNLMNFSFAEGATPEASDRGAFRFEIVDCEV